MHPRRRLSDYEMIFVRAGVLEIAEEDHPYSVHADQTLLLLPDRWHYGTKEYASDLLFYWVHFTLEGPSQIVTSVTQPVPEMFQIPQFTTVSRPDYLAELFRRYIDDDTWGKQDPISASLLVQLMLSEVQRPAPVRSASVLAARADSFIRTSFHLPLSASIAADHVGCNPRYLSRVYSQSYGCTLTESIQRTRIEYACRLLLGSDLKVGEIALACGMGDANYFHQLFKRLKGLTPTAFRRLHPPANIITD